MKTARKKGPMASTNDTSAGGSSTADNDDLIGFVDQCLVCSILFSGVAIQLSLSWRTNSKMWAAIVVNTFWVISIAYLLVMVIRSKRYSTRCLVAGVPAALLLTCSRGLRMLVNARAPPEASRAWLIGSAYVTNSVQATRTYSSMLTAAVLARMAIGLVPWARVTCILVPEVARVGMTFHAVHRIGGWEVVEDAVPHQVFADSIAFLAGAYFSSLDLGAKSSLSFWIL